MTKPEEDSVISILFLAADPTDASRLRLGEEFREIQEKLKLAKLRERFRLELPQLSVRPADISQALLDVQPQIVHFSGHGASSGALCFENQVGQTHLVQPDALAALFEQFAHQVNCVLLNACYAEAQAKAIAERIEYVIGMNQAIGDEAAIAFAIGFYQALGAGRAIEDAYKLGCVQIGLQGISEHLTPILITKQQAKKDDFPVEKLHLIKARHELWVQQTLSEDESKNKQLRPLSALLDFVQRLRPILFWLYRTVPAGSAKELFAALNDFWSDRNIATERIDLLLTHGVEVLLRPLTTDGFRSDRDDYSRGKLYRSSLTFSKYFSDRGIAWSDAPRDSEPTLIIRYLTRNFEDLLQNQALDESEDGIVRHVLFILRYYQSYVRAFKYVDITESLVSQFFTIIRPTLDQLGFQIPDAIDEHELFIIRTTCEDDLG